MNSPNNKKIKLADPLIFIQTGSLSAAFRGGVLQAVTAGLAQASKAFSALRGYGKFGSSVVHGVTQGAVNVLKGGKFGHGFVSAFASHYAGVSGWLGKGRYTSTFKAAILGGTVSKLTGGKFANGAITAAFVHLFNHLSAIQKSVNKLAKKVSQRGYFKSKAEADLIYNHNRNPDLTVDLDASRLTVNISTELEGSGWYVDKELGGMSAWGEVGDGSVLSTDFKTIGTVKVNNSTGVIKIIKETYSFEMKPWSTHAGRNLKTLLAHPGPGTPYWTTFRGSPSVR